jgi:hypothetical protein
LLELRYLGKVGGINEQHPRENAGRRGGDDENHEQEVPEKPASAVGRFLGGTGAGGRFFENALHDYGARVRIAPFISRGSWEPGGHFEVRGSLARTSLNDRDLV